MAFAAAALVIAADYLWLRLGSISIKRGLSVSTSVPARELTLGIREPYTVTAVHRGSTRLGMSLSLMVDGSIVTDPPDIKMELQSGREHMWNLEITTMRCGKFDVGHVKATVSSLFFQDSFPTGRDNFINVRLALGKFGIRSNIIYGTAYKASKLFRNVIEKRSGSDFAGVREYIAGDNIKNIDWALSARIGELCVREYEAERTLPVYVLLDMSHLPAEDGRASVDFSISVAMDYINRQLVDGDKLGLICFSKNGILYHVKPGMGRKHVNSLVDVLSKLQPMGDEAATDWCGPYVSIGELYDVEHALGRDAGITTLMPIIEETIKEYMLNVRSDGFIQAILTVTLTMKNPCQIKIVTGLSMGLPSFINGVRLAKYYGHSVTTIINASAYKDAGRSSDLKGAIWKLRSQSVKVVTPGQDEAPESILFGGRLTSGRRNLRG